MRVYLILVLLCLCNLSFAQTLDELNANKAKTPWDITYSAFRNTLGKEPTTFQLIMPFINWNCSEESTDTINSEIYNLINGIPAWNTNGKYQSGGSFTDAYKTFLNILIFKPDSALDNQSKLQYEILKEALDKYEATCTQAFQAYSKTETSLSFERWLVSPSPAGWAYGKRLILDKKNYKAQEELYDSYLGQLGNSLLHDSRQQFKDRAFYYEVYYSTLGDTLLLPGYEFMKLTRGDLKKSTAFNIELDWIIPGATTELNFINKNTNNKFSLIYDSLTISISFDKWEVVPVIPLPWYSEATIRAIANNKDAYRDGYAPYKSDGQSAWVFGKGGIMPARITDLLIGYNFKMQIDGITDSSVQLDNKLKNKMYRIKTGEMSIDGNITHIEKFGKKYHIAIQHLSESFFIWGVYIKTF